MDFLLAAKVSVTGVDGAVADLRRLEQAIKDTSNAAQAGDLTKFSNALKGLNADKAAAEFEKLERAVRGINVAGAIDDLGKLEASLRELRGQDKINVKVDADGVKNVTGDLEKVGRTLDELRAKDQVAVRVNTGDSMAEIQRLDNALSGLRIQDDLRIKVNTSGVREAQEEVSRLDTALGKIGTGVAYSAAYKGLDLIGEAARYAKDAIIGFDEAMTNALSIQPQGIKLFRDDMEDLARSLSTQFGMNVRDLGEGFYFLASAGLSAADQMKALPVAAALAKGGMMDLETATERLSQAWAIFRTGTNAQGGIGYSFEQVADQITQAANLSQGTIAQFADALTNKAGTAAVRFKVSLEDTMAVLMAFHERGVQGKVAGEQFSIVLRDLAIKANNNSEAFEQLGIKVFDAQGNMLPLLDIIGSLSDRFGGMAEQQRTAELGMLGFTLRSQGAISAIVQMSDRIEYFRGVAGNAFGETLRVAQEQMQSLQAKFDQAKAWVIEVSIRGFEKVVEFGGWLVDTFRPAVEAIAPAARAFAEGFGEVIAVFGKMAGAAVAETLRLIADAIREIGEFASAHEGTVRALGTALAALAVIKLSSNIAAWIGELTLALGGSLLGSLRDATAGVKGFLDQVEVISANKGPVAGLGRIADALIPLASRIGAVFAVANIVEFAQQIDKARDAADKFASVKLFENMGDKGQGGFAAFQETIGDVNTKIDELRDKANNLSFGGLMGQLGDVLIPFHDVKNSASDTVNELNRLEDTVGPALQKSAGYVDAFARALKGATLGPTLDPMIQKFEIFASTVPKANMPLEKLRDLLIELAAKEGLDLSGGVDEWGPKLGEAYSKWLAMQDPIDKVGLALDAMTEDIDEGVQSVDQLSEAFRKLMGGLTAFEGETAFQAALADLIAAAKESGLSLDSTTEAGRKTRDALAGAASAAVEYAKAVSGGDGAKFVQSLSQSREALVGVIQNLGLSRAEAEKLVDSLGLSAENIKKMAETAGLPIKIKADVSLDDAQRVLSQFTSKDQIVTVEAKAALALAESDLASFTGMSRSTTVDANANMTPAEGSMSGFTGTDHRTTVTVEGNVSPAEVTIGGVTGRDWRALVTAGADVVSAQNAIMGVSEFPWATTVTAGADPAPAVDSLSAIQSFPWRANILAVGDTAAAEADLAYLARTRQAYINLTVRMGSTVPGMYEADGGVVDYYARGGIRRENHVAQIAPAGAWRVWAEPETGGEAYIPLASSKRARSRDIWLETGRRLGMLEQYASGKVVGPALTIRGGGGGGGVTISPGAIAVSVDAPGAVDPAHVGRVVEDAIGPALDAFAGEIISHMRRRKN